MVQDNEQKNSGDLDPILESMVPCHSGNNLLKEAETLNFCLCTFLGIL